MGLCWCGVLTLGYYYIIIYYTLLLLYYIIILLYYIIIIYYTLLFFCSLFLPLSSPSSPFPTLISPSPHLSSSSIIHLPIILLSHSSFILYLSILIYTYLYSLLFSPHKSHTRMFYRIEEVFVFCV